MKFRINRSRRSLMPHHPMFRIAVQIRDAETDDVVALIPVNDDRPIRVVPGDSIRIEVDAFSEGVDE